MTHQRPTVRLAQKRFRRSASTTIWPRPQNHAVDNFLSNTPASSAQQHGFTLVELLVSMAVLAVLLGIAVPSFQAVVASSQLSSRTNDLVGALSLARSEAIRRGVRVTLCKSSDGASCASTGDWDQGWITFVDTTRSGTDAAVDSGETVIQIYQGNANAVSIKGSTNVANYVSFASDGRAKVMAGTPQTGTLRPCSSSTALSNDSRARSIEITTTGRVSSTSVSGIASSCPAP